MQHSNAVTVGYGAPLPLHHAFPPHPLALPGGMPVYFSSPTCTDSGRGSDYPGPQTGARPRQRQPGPPPFMPRPATAPRKESVFITYSNDGRRHLETVLNMAQHLSHSGYTVHVDMLQRHFQGMDRMGWLDDDKVANSDFIIVVCSPKYRRDANSASGPDEDDDHGLNTRYINRAIQVTYLDNRCINYKVIPILFDGYAKDACPVWLRNTTLYRWPRHVQDVMCRLRREERYTMPATGRPPVITVRRDYT